MGNKERRLTEKGYMRYAKDGKLRMEHRIVWEEAYGKIEDGYFIHHIDFNKTNNDISNLQKVTALEHKRLHSGCRLVNGEWEKQCRVCGCYKLTTNDFWYFSRGWINGTICKTCFIQKSLNTRKKLIENGWRRKNYTRTPKL